MKKYSIIYFFMMQALTIIGMNFHKEREAVEKMEILRRVRKRDSLERDNLKMSTEMITQSDDEMSLDKSGHIPRCFPKAILQKEIHYFMGEYDYPELFINYYGTRKTSNY